VPHAFVPVRTAGPGTISMKKLLSITGVSKSFPLKHGVVRAVRNVSFQIGSGETVGLVGESGCGKSTLGRTVIRLYEPELGKIVLGGKDITHLTRSELRPHRCEMQIIFQDPYASLNPRKTIGQTLEMPLIVHRFGSPPARKERVKWLMSRVGLTLESMDRHPHEFSGGQRQRVGIARALALNPKFIVCDEPVSALDVSVQAQVINLLKEIQSEMGLAYLFISHDLSVVAHFCHRVIVMYLGQFVEIADRSDIWTRPLHPYTRALIKAVPIGDIDRSRGKIYSMLQGEIPSPLNPPAGCSFHTRCQWAIPRCREEEPELLAVDGSEHQVACHRTGEI
jgi:oligopeptide/dipeptide ABC transporter ATP-binding protein